MNSHKKLSTLHSSLPQKNYCLIQIEDDSLLILAKSPLRFKMNVNLLLKEGFL